MIKYIFSCIISLSLLLYSSSRVQAQTTIYGQEAMKATVNFNNLASQQQSQATQAIQDPENEAEDLPAHPYPSDTTLIHRRNNYTTQGPSYFTANMPPSPAATDSFEAVLDNGTVIPPDTHGAVDSNYCVTATNSTIKIQNRNGSSVSSVSLNSFWNSINSSGGCFDPRVHYDPFAARWIIITVAHGQSSSSSLLVGVSQTSNPTGNWYLYSIVADSSGTNWFDFPDVGFNKKWIVVTGNYFSVSNNTFATSNVFAFNKANLLSGTSANYTRISESNDFTICPVLTYDSALNNMFLIESWDGSAGTLKLAKLSGPVGSPTFTTIGYPTTSTLWQSNAVPDNFAPQSGNSNGINTNDDRITQSVLINNKIWCAQTIFLPYSATANPTRCSIQWWQVDTAANIVQNSTIDDNTGAKYFAFPCISVNKYNDALIGFSNYSSSIYPSASYAIRSSTDPTDSIRVFHTYRAGQNSYYKVYSGTRNRWGDYSGAALDPINSADFWTVQEASASAVNTWDTWWAHVTNCSMYKANITPSGPTTLCSGGNVTLAADTGTGGYGYQWLLNGANIGGATSKNYTATNSGTYTLTITKNNCILTSSGISVSISSATIGAITGNSSLCPGATLNLNDTSANGTWSSDNSNIATVNASGVVSGVAAGSVNIVYTVTNGVCVDSVIKNITVYANPTVAATSGPNTVCTNSTISLGNTTQNGLWSSDNSTIAGVNASGTVTGINAGTVNILYTVTNGNGCTDSAIKTITVNAQPVLSTISGSNSVCLGASISLGNTTNGGTWSSSNTNIATINSIGILNSIAAGTVTIKYSVTNASNCTDSAIKSVTVNALPVIGTISGPSSVCVGNTIYMNDSSTNGSWSVNNTNYATINSSGALLGVGAGSVHVVYTKTDGNGCIDSAVKIVAVNSIPTLGVISGNSSVCVGNTTNLSCTPNGGTWSAYNGHATVSGVGVVTGVSVGIDTIKYVYSNNCGRDSTIKVININPETNPGTITGKDTVCIGSTIALSHTGTSGTWACTNTNANVSALGIVTGVNSGKDTVTYTVSGSCGNVAAKFPIVILTQHICDSLTLVYNLGAETPLVNIYPNPNKGNFMVEVNSANNEKVDILLSNVLGQQLKEYTGYCNHKIEIAADLPPAVYIITVSTPHSKFSGKITITR